MHVVKTVDRNYENAAFNISTHFLETKTFHSGSQSLECYFKASGELRGIMA